MSRKVLTPSVVVTNVLLDMVAHAADIRIGVTIYKHDDSFISVVHRAVEKDTEAAPGIQLPISNSQNDQFEQNDQIGVLLAKDVKTPVTNLVDPTIAGMATEKARGWNVPVVLFNKRSSRKTPDSYGRAYYVDTDSREFGITQGDLIVKHWAASLGWDPSRDSRVRFVLLKGEPGYPNAEAHITYVIRELGGKGIKTEQLQLDTAMWDIAQARDEIDT